MVEPGDHDSMMVYHEIDIEDDLILLGVHLNIPPFLCGKQQFSQQKLITTCRITSLRIHVERAMERIKNFHIFDRSLPLIVTDIVNCLFFVWCVLKNFQPPIFIISKNIINVNQVIKILSMSINNSMMV